MLLISTMITISIMFTMMKHPLTAGLTLIVQTTMIGLMLGKMIYNFWFSYIMFLIMIGGMLVLFLYMTSTASNEKFKFSMINLIIMMIWLSINLIMIMNDKFFNLYMKLMDMSLMASKEQFQLVINKYVNYPHVMIYTMIIIYLLITLIAVVKITSKKEGALRQKF